MTSVQWYSKSISLSHDSLESFDLPDIVVRAAEFGRLYCPKLKVCVVATEDGITIHYRKTFFLHLVGVDSLSSLDTEIESPAPPITPTPPDDSDTDNIDAEAQEAQEMQAIP